jgi:ankyrin repeat protein
MVNTKRLMIVLLVLSGGLVLTGCARVHAPPALVTAIKHGNIEKVKSIVGKNPKLVYSTYQGATPLHWAVSWSPKKEVVVFLIEKGADVNAKDENGRTPLHWAVNWGYKEVVELLIEKGSDVNAKDESGRTPLHEAVAWGHLKERGGLVELLIEKGADVNTKDDRGETPLHDAVTRGHKEVVELLIEKGADVNVKYENGGTPLHDVAGFLYVRGEDNLQEIKDRSIEIAKVLIAKGAEVNAKDNRGRTPLHIAMSESASIPNFRAPGMRGSIPIYFTREGFPEMVDLLKKHGAVK